MTASTIDRGALNRLTAEIVTWLDPTEPAAIARAAGGWPAHDWRVAETVVNIQGLGAFFHAALPHTLLDAVLPPAFRQFLADSYAANAARVARLHDDLAAILRAMGRAGIEVMPLKGSLLSTGYYRTPALRPMADLDLLIHPGDGPGLIAALAPIGYHVVLPAPGAAGFKLARPGQAGIASRRLEHPDNPRPVEVHTRAGKWLWGRAGGFDLTDYLWASSRAGELLGEPVCLPEPERLAVHLAAHALAHHLVGAARAIQWLDLALVAEAGQATVLAPPDPNWVYPALRLAARALPRRLAGAAWPDLERRTHRRLRVWADSVRLDGRCGLNLDPALMARGRNRMRWDRWQPAPWRLALAFPCSPLGGAYARYMALLARHLWGKAGARLAAGDPPGLPRR